MRPLLGLAAALFTLFALPVAASAATTPCGFLNGLFDIAGRTYAGEATYAGVTYQIAVSFNRECGVVLSQTGKNSRGGTWLQKNDKMAIKVGDADFLGTVAADGAITGQMVTQDNKVGTFALKAPRGAPTPPAPKAPAPQAPAPKTPAPKTPAPASASPLPGGGSGACGRGDAAHGYIVGQIYDGALTWGGGEPESLSLTFKADCSVGYVYRDGSVGKAEWRQEGEYLMLNVNDGYSTYEGKLVGDQYIGKLKNELGKTGFFAFDRK